MSISSPTIPFLRGIVPPLITPLDASGGLDEKSLCRLIDHVVEGGVHGLFILGTTGEWASLAPSVRRQVIDVSCRAARGRVPVVVHVTNPSVAESLDDARHAAKANAQAIVVSAPYYYPMTQAELFTLVQRLLDEQPLPVILYNIPQMARTEYEMPTIEKLLEFPRVIGFKDSSGDMEYHRRLISLTRARPDFRVLVGTEMLLASMVKAGSHGCVGGGANLCPRLLVSLYEAAVAGNDSQIAILQEELRTLGGLFRMDGAVRCIGALKAAVCIKGIIASDRMADPYLSPSAADRAAVGQILRDVENVRHKSSAAPSIEVVINAPARSKVASS